MVSLGVHMYANLPRIFYQLSTEHPFNTLNVRIIKTQYTVIDNAQRLSNLLRKDCVILMIYMHNWKGEFTAGKAVWPTYTFAREEGSNSSASGIKFE